MLGLSTRWCFAASVVGGLMAVGCVDPDGDYQDFIDRQAKTTLPTGSGCGDPNAACDPVKGGQLDGQWLFALSAKISPTKPVLFFTEVKSSESSGQVTWEMTLTPLDAKTREPLPDSLPTVQGTPIPADGNWSADLGEITVPGAANPITYGSDIVATSSISGQICGGRDFLCGDLKGQASKPLTIPLDGSTWTLAKLPAPNTLPEKIYINCSCAEAGPPAS